MEAYHFNFKHGYHICAAKVAACVHTKLAWLHTAFLPNPGLDAPALPAEQHRALCCSPGYPLSMSLFSSDENDVPFCTCDVCTLNVTIAIPALLLCLCRLASLC